MNKLLLSIAVGIFFVQVASAQIGVGTENPNVSAQLDVFSADSGILIPRVPLNSTRDLSTIRYGNVNSLLVFNTQTINDVTPGYYYWYEYKWFKLASTSNGIEEFITTLLNLGDGQFEYTSEDGTQTLIDIPAVIVKNIINEGAIYDEIINIVLAEEKTTTLVDGENTMVESVTTGNQTEYKVNVATAEGTNLGVVKEVADNPTVTINQNGELAVNITNLHAVVEVSEDYSPLFDTDATILGNAIGRDIEITLPSPTLNTKGKKYTIKKLNADETYYIHVSGEIEGLGGQVLYTAIPYTGWDFISDGVQWHIVNSF